MTYEEAGGSAFPITNGALGVTYLGPSARDYFAAKAMQGVIASCVGTDIADAAKCARFSYEMADAMLEARK